MCEVGASQMHSWALGRVSRCEEYLLRCDFGELRAVLDMTLAKYATETELKRRVLKRPAAARPTEQQQEPDDVPVHANLEEQQEYSKRMGKWSKQVLQALKDPLLEAMFRIGKASRRPLDHFVHLLCKKRPHGEPLGLARLVFYKARGLESDLNAITVISADPWPSILEIAPAELREGLC